MVAQVVPGLFVGFVGDAVAAGDYALWVNCTPDVGFPTAVAQPARVRVPVVDTPRDRSQPERLMRRLPSVVHAIHSRLLDGDRVLLWSRPRQQVGSAIAAAYVMWSEDKGYDVAIARVRAAVRSAFLWQSAFMTTLNNWTTYLRALQLANNPA